MFRLRGHQHDEEFRFGFSPESRSSCWNFVASFTQHYLQIFFRLGVALSQDVEVGAVALPSLTERFTYMHCVRV